MTHSDRWHRDDLLRYLSIAILKALGQGGVVGRHFAGLAHDETAVRVDVVVEEAQGTSLLPPLAGASIDSLQTDAVDFDRIWTEVEREAQRGTQ